MKRFITLVNILIIIFGIATFAGATLIDRGGGLIYDDDLNITWLQDANYAKTSGYHPTGDMPWNEAVEWINYLNNSNFLNYNDWRLPAILPVNGVYYDMTFSYDGSTDNGYNIMSPNSELAYMFYVNLGNLGWFDDTGNLQAGSGLTNVGPFMNIQPAPYWSGNEYPNGSGKAWNIHLNAGLQNNIGGIYYPWAVRDGDINPVPEPSTMLLLGSGFAGITLLRKRLKA